MPLQSCGCVCAASQSCPTMYTSALALSVLTINRIAGSLSSNLLFSSGLWPIVCMRNRGIVCVITNRLVSLLFCGQQSWSSVQIRASLEHH